MKGRSLAAVLLVFLNVASAAIGVVVILALLSWVSGAGLAVQLGPGGAPSVTIGSDIPTYIPVAFTMNSQLRDVRGSLALDTGSGSFRVLANLFVLGLLGLSLWVLTRLRSILRTAHRGEPFAPDNATHVTNIAWAVIVGEIARAAVVYAGNRYAMTHVQLDGVVLTARPDVNVFVLALGLILLVLAAIFREGARLHREQSLTV